MRVGTRRRGIRTGRCASSQPIGAAPGIAFASGGRLSERAPWQVGWVLLVAISAISAAAVLVSALQEPHALAMAFWRTFIVAVLLLPCVRRVSRADAVRIALAGVCLAAHFGTWFASLQQTTVLRSTVLVTLAPVWAGLVEWLVLRQPPARRYWLGLLLAVPAVALLASDGGGGSVQGDLLAVVGGLVGAVYFLIGRSVRKRVGLATYGSLVCAAAAATLLPVALVGGVPLVGFSWGTWLALLALALGPQMLGHNGLNYALRYLPASLVTAVTLLEPVGATALALVVLGQVPPVWAVVGGLLTLLGVGVATVPGRRRAR